MKKIILLLFVLLIAIYNVYPQLPSTSILFDGTNDVITVPGTSSFSLGTGDFTIEAWTRDQALVGATTEEIFSIYSSSNVHLRFFIYFGNAAFNLNNHLYVAAVGQNLRNGQCHHVAVKRQSGSLSFYIDGIFVIGGIAMPYTVTDGTIALGGFLGNTTSFNSFNGLLKEIRLWNIARADTQIQASKDSVVTGSSGLIGYWRLNEASGVFVQDYAGSNNGIFGYNFNPATYPIWSNGCPDCTPVPVNIIPNGNLNFCTGSGITLQANTGTGLTYLWKKNNSNIAGATNSNYLANSTGTFMVVVTNSSGCSATSAGVSVTSPPSNTVSANGSTHFCTGGSVTLTSTSGQTVTYKWKKNGAYISGATNSSYVATTTGSYNCIVTNSFGCSKGGNPIAVTGPPSSVITANGATTFCAGDSVKLSAQSGYTYQWIKNSGNISGATQQNYTAKTAGNYKVKVTDNFSCSKTTPNANQITVSIPCREANVDLVNTNNELISTTIFPNPSTNDFTLSVSKAGSETISISIFDFTGRIVFTRDNISSTDNLKFGKEFLPGIYSVEVLQDNSIHVLKIIKIN